MANTIAIVPGTSFLSTLGNLFLTVLFIVLFVALAAWMIRQIPTVGNYVPYYPSN